MVTIKRKGFIMKDTISNSKMIMSAFAVKGECVSCAKYGEGHINETYKVIMNDNGIEKPYILQKINNKIFTNVDQLMSNIQGVTDFARSKIIEHSGDPDRESLTLILTKDSKPYYFDGEGYYRVFIFIDKTVAIQKPESVEIFASSAYAFGKFANLLAEYPADKLYETIPNFHNTVDRYEKFLSAVKADVCGRASSVQEQIKFVMDRKDYCSRITSLLDSKKMPIRVTHNDTKLNNVLFDESSLSAIAVIDLDTIMSGSVCYDFGDAIRFGCNTGAEDEPDLTKVNFDIELFEAYVKSYLLALGDGITQIEKDTLAFSAILLTFECGMRFLTDYLSGDTYFKIHRENHNLDRTGTQFKLVSDMEKVLDKMEEIVRNC